MQCDCGLLTKGVWVCKVLGSLPVVETFINTKVLGAKLCCEKIRLSLWSCLLDLGPCDQVCDLGEGLCIGRMSGHAHKGSFENSIAFQEGLVYVVK